MAGASCRHVHSSGGQCQQQEWGPDAGTLAVVGALAVGMHCWVLAGSTAMEAGVEIQTGACKHTAGGLAAGEPCGAGQQQEPELLLWCPQAGMRAFVVHVHFHGCMIVHERAHIDGSQ